MVKNFVYRGRKTNNTSTFVFGNTTVNINFKNRDVSEKTRKKFQKAIAYATVNHFIVSKYKQQIYEAMKGCKNGYLLENFVFNYKVNLTDYQFQELVNSACAEKDFIGFGAFLETAMSENTFEDSLLEIFMQTCISSKQYEKFIRLCNLAYDYQNTKVFSSDLIYEYFQELPEKVKAGIPIVFIPETDSAQNHKSKNFSDSDSSEQDETPRAARMHKLRETLCQRFPTEEICNYNFSEIANMKQSLGHHVRWDCSTEEHEQPGSPRRRLSSPPPNQLLLHEDYYLVDSSEASDDY